MNQLLVSILFVPVFSFGGDLIVTVRLDSIPPKKDNPFEVGAGEEVVDLESKPINQGTVISRDLREISYIALEGAKIPRVLLESRITLMHDWSLPLGELNEPLRKALSGLAGQNNDSPDWVLYSGSETNLVLAPTGVFVFQIGDSHIAMEFLQDDDGVMLLRCRKVFATISISNEPLGSVFMLRGLGRRALSGSVLNLVGDDYLLLKGKLANELWGQYSQQSMEMNKGCELHRFDKTKSPDKN